MPVQLKSERERLNDLIFSPPQIGTVLYMPGLPGAGSRIYDRSPYGNNGTITGATWKRRPSGLWGLSFDGVDDRVTIANPSFIANSQGAISFWAIVDTDAQHWIFYMGNPVTGNVDGFALGYDARGSITQLKLDLTINTTLTNRIITDVGTILDSVLYHIVFVSTGSAYQYYINGVSKTVTASIGVDDGKWFSSLVTDADTLMLGQIRWNGADVATMTGKVYLPIVLDTAPATTWAMQIYQSQKHLFGVW